MTATQAVISLEELLERAELQTRQDRKYLLDPDALVAFERALPSEVAVLEIAGRRQFGYRSDYYDNAELTGYLAAVRARRRRFKVRLRTYLDSGLQHWEVKTRGPRGATVKHRFPVRTAEPLIELPDALRWAGLWSGLAAGLAPVLTTTYTRRTLFLPTTGSRVTVDTALGWRTPEGRRFDRPGLVIIETKSDRAAGPVDRLLWSLGHRPRTVSKYGTGMAALHPHLPAHKWRPVLRRHFAG